jgi:cell division protein ZapE
VSTPVSDRYAALVRDGAIESDPAQLAALRRLDALTIELGEYRLARKSSPLGWLFGARKKVEAPKGLYIWGAVGRGKTMLMDLFFEASQVRRKRRVHFHAFMADVHARVHAWRQQKKAGSVKGEDPITPIADALFEEAWLLCFDEFAVTDIADAMILGRLFTALFARGVVVVATSNVEPARLYEGGLNRALFTPFIALMQQRMDVMELVARTDFRLEKLSGAPVYHTPADAAAQAALTTAFRKLTGRDRGAPATLDVLGRSVAVPQAEHGVARFGFRDLCEIPLGATDYLEIARAYHTVLIDGIPVMGFEKRNEARRLIWLIDAFYDQHVKVVASAEAEPHRLYTAKDGREVFEFERTASRLIEMRSTEYLALPHGASESGATGESTGLVET